MVLVPSDELVQSPQVNALEALLGGSSNFHAMLDMPPDADDERMVELAIALSLQEQSGGHSGGLSLQAMHLGGHQQVNVLGLGWFPPNSPNLLTQKLFFSRNSESTTGYTFTPFGIFYFPWYKHQIEGTTGF